MSENLNAVPESDVAIFSRVDGIYISARPSSSIFKMEVLDLIDVLADYGVENIDKGNVEILLKSKPGEIKISEQSNLSTSNERIVVEFLNGDMVAVCKFIPPVSGGKRFGEREILDALGRAGVIFGIDHQIIDQLQEDREYFKGYEVAFGKPAINGIDGKQEFYFDTAKKLLKPKVMENGSVDFMNLDMIQKTYSGRELVRLIEPTPGINGVDVRGATIFAKPGKPAPKLPRGKNVVSSDDELQLFSGIDGQIQFENNKVSVLPVLEIKSDVDLSTGNIDFNGAVNIKGGVRENFVVKARGIIEIGGTVEGAIIESDADIFLYSGVMGANKARVRAQGNVVAKFIDSANVFAGGNITADSIMHSDVECNGEIILEGKNGLLVGGTTWAVDKIIANEIGSSMATRTEVNIGKTPSLGETGDVLFKQIDEIKFKISKLEKIIDTLKALGNNISPEQKALLLKSNHTKILLATEQRKITKDIDELNGKISAKRAKLSVRSLISPGVILTMGSARKKFERPVTYATFVSKNGEIEEVPFSE